MKNPPHMYADIVIKIYEILLEYIFEIFVKKMEVYDRNAYILRTELDQMSLDFMSCIIFGFIFSIIGLLLTLNVLVFIGLLKKREFLIKIWLIFDGVISWVSTVLVPFQTAASIVLTHLFYQA